MGLLTTYLSYDTLIIYIQSAEIIQRDNQVARKLALEVLNSGATRISALKDLFAISAYYVEYFVSVVFEK